VKFKNRKKVYEDLPKVEVYQPNLDGFFTFMHERHMVYVNRFMLQLPPPWTENPILRDYKFTNVYRELDRGTLWYKDNIVPLAHGLKELIWLTTMYRLVNRIETFQIAGLPSLGSWPELREHFRKALKTLHWTSTVFTNAHLTLPTRSGKSKIDTYISSLDWLHKHISGLADVIAVCKIPGDVFQLLHTIPGVGDFIAYEIWCDLVLAKAIQFTENDFVNPGPGCKTGLKCIFPTLDGRENYIEKIKLLQREQDRHFKRLGLDFQYLRGTPMTLRSIEHSLCEFSKYCKMKTGIGKQRMYFKPITGEDPRGKQTVLRFPRTRVS